MFVNDDEAEDLMAVIHGFFDESGKDPQLPVVGFAGFVAPSKQWVRFKEKWTVALRQHGLDAFHFSEHCGMESAVYDFIRIIKRRGETGLSVNVDVRAFHALPSNLRKDLGNNAYFLAFKYMVLYLIRHKCANAALSFTWDENQQFDPDLFKWYKNLKTNDEIARQRLACFAIGHDEHFPQIQGATYWRLLRVLRLCRR